MAPRALWKGFLKVAELSCAVGLYAAVSRAERISFHMVDRASGQRVARQFVDEETGAEVPREDQVKGYETGAGDYVVLEPDEIAAVVPDSTKTLPVEAFLACDDIDPLYFDMPYYLAPADRAAGKAFALIREVMAARKVAALARTVLFRRVRTVLIRPQGAGFIATTLHYDYEVRSADAAFEDLPEIKVQGEMLELAEHIIKTKSGSFDPAAFDDRYEAALAELVKAKLEGRKVRAPKPAATGKVVDLMDALRRSAGRDAPASGGTKRATKRASATKTAAKTATKSASKAKSKAKTTSKPAAKAAAPARRKAG
ncbi:Ku protein [Azorhizobium doebereinerae]|uniref:non-homologous end joining protein Ku n=1 Tax=Azorhizobium doebereinerae TaxID=281091 RepID=UPI00040B8E78|nr:Ku protein [Azorhizobium doebereinerae]